MEHKCNKTDLKPIEKCELNAEQIKKALECCSSSDGVFACESGCPYWGGVYDDCPCTEDPNFILKNAIALITSQEQRIGAQDMTISELRQRVEKADHDARRYGQRIKELTEENEKLTINMNAYGLTAKRLGEENERLKAENEMLLNIKKLNLDKVIADTVRKMQERIKERCIKGGIYPAFIARTVDQIAEEIIGGARQ